MKALILAAGKAKRLKLENKAMLKVSGKPLIEYSLDIAASLEEIDEIIIVVGHKAEQIINTYGVKYHHKKIRYRIQSPLKGPVAAMHAAREDLEGHDFFLFFASEILPQGRHRQMIHDFRRKKSFVTCGMIKSSDPSLVLTTYSVIQDSQGRIFRLIAHPARVINEWMGTGCCLCRAEILDYIKSVPVHPAAKEKTLPDLIQTAVDHGHPVRSYVLGEEYTGICTKDDLNMQKPPEPRKGKEVIYQ